MNHATSITCAHFYRFCLGHEPTVLTHQAAAVEPLTADQQDNVAKILFTIV